jgi:hypothetical protein
MKGLESIEQFESTGWWQALEIQLGGAVVWPPFKITHNPFCL